MKVNEDCVLESLYLFWFVVNLRKTIGGFESMYRLPVLNPISCLLTIRILQPGHQAFLSQMTSFLLHMGFTPHQIIDLWITEGSFVPDVSCSSLLFIKSFLVVWRTEDYLLVLHDRPLIYITCHLSIFFPFPSICQVTAIGSR